MPFWRWAVHRGVRSSACARQSVVSLVKGGGSQSSNSRRLALLRQPRATQRFLAFGRGSGGVAPHLAIKVGSVLANGQACSSSSKSQNPSSNSSKLGMACEACMKIPPVVSDYTGTGTNEKLGDVDVYFTGSGEKGIVFIPDIFGVTPQAIQVADKLGSAGFVVGFPDVFRGEPWPLSKFPPPDRNELMTWIHGYTFEGKVKPDIDKVVDALKAKGASKFAIVGFCWGGKMSTLAAEAPTVFSASASAHPSFLNNEDAAKVSAPILLLPSKDEADLTEFISIVAAKGIPASQTRFDDMHHGWVAARGDWKDPHQAARATEAIQLFADFFKQHLA